MVDAKTIQRYKKRSMRWLLSKTQEHFNRYIRERDSKDGLFKCISCSGWKDVSKMNAGHYLSVGHNGFQRFNEDNCHGQCVKCNMYLGGNLLEYRKGLIEKIGSDRVEYLDIPSKHFKWDRISVIEKMIHYRELNNKNRG